MNTVSILLASFVLSIAALMFFIWSLRKGLMDSDPAAAKVIFYPDELGQTEDRDPSSTTRFTKEHDAKACLGQSASQR
jgi:cytochrome c oxidase cbb3-type subunit I